MIKLFISYRSLDSAKVDRLVARIGSLKNTDGTPRYQLWQDKYSIPAGQDWWQAIVQGIIDCDLFVFMISRESVQNVNCRDELTYARKRNRPIIPFVLEDEFYYNPANGKNNLDYWEHMPSELNDTRFQYLFYEGVSFVEQLNGAVDRLIGLGLRDIPTKFPPDPRNAESNDTIVIYDQACDYALRLEFDTARAKFQRLIDWQDSLFMEDAYGWMELLHEYENLVQLDERKNTRHQISPLWAKYEAQFPKPFIEGIFDPKDFKSRYKVVPSTSVENVQPQSPNPKANPSPEATIQPIQEPKPKQGSSTPIKTATQEAKPKQASSTPIKTAIPLVEAAKPNPLILHQDPRAIARAFKGKRNSDWTPIFQTFEVKGIKMEMCLVPLGTFQMGSDDPEVGMPIHPQRLLQPYWIGVHPVTNAQWRMAVSKSTKVTVPEWDVRYKVKNAANHPVVGVTYYQCMEFVKWLGDEWSLPTEPEWEYAARGIDNLLYPFGKKLQPDIVVYSANSNKRTKEIGGRVNNISWVGAKDMSGNVWEWMRSRYREGKYNGDDGREEISKFSECVLRGGSWTSNETFLQAVSRSRLYPTDKRNDVGFRCIRSV